MTRKRDSNRWPRGAIVKGVGVTNESGQTVTIYVVRVRRGRWWSVWTEPVEWDFRMTHQVANRAIVAAQGSEHTFAVIQAGVGVSLFEVSARNAEFTGGGLFVVASGFTESAATVIQDSLLRIYARAATLIPSLLAEYDAAACCGDGEE
jgi:hypothetical protein